MNAKRIVLSLGTLVFAAAVVAGGTGAFFSDTETAEGNVFTAGTVSLDMGSIDHDYFGDDNNAPIFTTPGGSSFGLDDLKPLDWGEITFGLDNGANEAFVCAMVTNDPDGGIDAQSLALYDQLNFFQGDGTQVTPGDWFSLGTVEPNSPVSTGVDYCFGDSNVDGTGLISCDYGDGSIDYNAAQGGSFEADLLFYAIQTRNNDDFTCDQLTMDDGEPVYVPGPAPVDPVDATVLNNWPTLAGADQELFKGEGRIGNNGPAGDWELGVGTNTQSPGNFEEENYEWTSGDVVPFSLVYDSVTGDATFTIDGVTQTDNVGSITSTDDLYFVARGDSVALTNLMLDGAPVNPAGLASTGSPTSLLIDTVDLSGGFTASGDVAFTFTGSETGSALDFQVVVAN